MIDSMILADGVTECVTVRAEDKVDALDITLHYHQPAGCLLGFRIISHGEVVATMGDLTRHS